LRNRCQELTEQNELLHHQLEALGAQAARIRQAAVSTDTPVNQQGNAAELVDQQLTDLRSVISYLRKEKEIIDLQLEMSKQDAARSKTEIEHLNRVLEETRGLLTEVSHQLVGSD
jgi:nucleoprotein TPR